MPRFVVLHHECPSDRPRPTHWDLLLEDNSVLLAWALNCEPAADKEIVAEAIADHRREYLTYEGPVSGNRGSVRRWDAGEYDWLEKSAEKLVIRVAGEHLVGRLEMVRTSDASQRWRLIWSRS
ncbi:MAG: hypothetical protein KDA42_01815 [Planctomycetales bacterium]|nr:hypothetical protein [Planctomycetales bacterium]